MQPEVKRRRSPDVVRRLILEAAATCFGEKGFSGTTFKDIAAAAGVAESQVVRNFHTKAELLAQAVEEPLRHYVEAFQARWDRDDAVSSDELERHLVSGLYDLCREHRRLFLVLISVRSFESGLLGDVDVGFAAALRDMESRDAYLARRAEMGTNAITLRAAVGMVLAMAVLDDFLYAPEETLPDRDSAVDELVTLIRMGIHRQR